MFFTREDILKIQQVLLQLGVKDSELPSTEYATYDDTLSIVQDGKNKKIEVKDFFNQISLWKKEDFLNITDKYDEHYISLRDAINLVPVLQRKDGLVITFQDINGDWRIYQFRGNIIEFLNKEKWFDLYDYRNYIVQSIVPDEEDLTASTPDENGNSLVHLKDRVYNPAIFNGKGYKFVRKNIINVELATIKISVINPTTLEGDIYFNINNKGTTVHLSPTIHNTTKLVSEAIKDVLVTAYNDYKVTVANSVVTLTRKYSGNTSPTTFEMYNTGVKVIVEDYTTISERNIITQENINKADTIYEIRYNFDLDGKIITIPKNCVLYFTSGKFYNGSINMDNTIISTLYEDILSEVNINGNYYNIQKHIKDHQSQLDDKQAQIDDKQQQITANNEDISLLQTRSTQMEETIKSIAATGGASQATAVTYNNEKSGLTAINAQAAIDEVNFKLSDLRTLLSTNQFIVLGKKDGYAFNESSGALVSGYENYYVTDKIDYYGTNFATNVLTRSNNVEVYCWDSDGNYLGYVAVKSYNGVGYVAKADIIKETTKIAFLGLKDIVPTIKYDFSIPEFKQKLLLVEKTIYDVAQGTVIKNDSAYFTTNKIPYSCGTIKTNIFTRSKNSEVYCWDSDGNYLGWNAVHRPYIFQSDLLGGTSYVSFLGFEQTGNEYVLMENVDNSKIINVDNMVIYGKSRNVNTGKFQQEDNTYLTTKIIPYRGRLITTNMKYGVYSYAVYCFNKYGQFIKTIFSYGCSEVLPKDTYFIGVSCNQDNSGKYLLLEQSKDFIQHLTAGSVLKDNFDVDGSIINQDYECVEGEGKISQIYKVESSLSLRYKYLFNYNSPAKEFRFLDESFEPLIGAFTKQGGAMDGYAKMSIPPTASYIQFCAPKGFSYNSDYCFIFDNEKFSNQIDLVKDGLRWNYNTNGINTEVDNSINLEKNGYVQSSSTYDSPYMKVVAYFRITSNSYNISIGSEGGYSSSTAQIKGDSNSATLTFYCGPSPVMTPNIIGEPITIPALQTGDGTELTLVAKKYTNDDNQFSVSLFGVDGSLVWSYNMDYSKDENLGDRASMSGRPLFAIYEDTEAILYSCKISFNKYTKENPKMLIIGHSFVEGNSMFGQKSKTFTHLLELALGTENVVVTGLGGDTTEGVFKRSQRYLSMYNKAKYCFIVTGTNDTNFDSYKEYLDKITKWCKAYNIEPIYTTVSRLRGQVQSELYNQMTHYVVSIGKYVDLRRALENDNKFVDMTHPNADGHRCIYNLLGAIEPCLND